MAKKKTPSKQQSNKATGFKGIEKKVIVPVAVPSPVQQYTENMGRSRVPKLQWEVPEWDLAENNRILDVESLVRRSFKNKKNLFLKEGYSFVGFDPSRVEYIRTRFKQMEFATGIPFPMLISQTVASLTRHNNAFWVKVRDEKASGGTKRTLSGGKTLDPVAGYFPLAAETVRFKRDSYGKVKKYQQYIAGKEPKSFSPEDVVHFHFEKREGFSIGTPDLVAVKDDIRALRRIEENIELLIYNHLFPLFHYTVGTEDRPAGNMPDGRSEVEVVQAHIAAMPSDSCWVTPERHSIKVLGAEGQALGVEYALTHFKNRVIVGLGNSTVDMGEGSSASRSTAQTMSRILLDDIKASQKEFGAQVYTHVIQELLLESTFSDNNLYEDKNRVLLKFNEIDIESRQAKNNHAVDLFTKNALTHPEMREMMGREPLKGEAWQTKGSGGTEDWAQTSNGLIERDKIVLQSLDEPGTEPAKKEVASRTKKNNESSQNKAVSNKNQPKNQHGTRASAKVNKDVEQVLRSYFSLMAANVKNGIADKEKSLKIFDSSMKDIKNRMLRDLRFSFKSSYMETCRDYPVFSFSEIEKHVERRLDWFIDSSKIILSKTMTWKKALIVQDLRLLDTVVKITTERLSRLAREELQRVSLFGEAMASKELGFDVKDLVNNQNCEKCSEKSFVYKNTNDIIYEELPPFYPGCTCAIKK